MRSSVDTPHPSNATHMKVIPSLVTALSGQGITDIVCGKAFSVALTDG